MATTASREAARELVLYALNDRETYMRSLTTIMDSMDRKRQRGIFDATKAAKGFESCAEYAARRYTADFGGVWHQTFNAATRRAAAALILDYYLDDIA